MNSTLQTLIVWSRLGVSSIQELSQRDLAALRSGSNVLTSQVGYDLLTGTLNVDVGPLINTRHESARPVTRLRGRQTRGQSTTKPGSSSLSLPKP